MCAFGIGEVLLEEHFFAENMDGRMDDIMAIRYLCLEVSSWNIIIYHPLVLLIMTRMCSEKKEWMK